MPERSLHGSPQVADRMSKLMFCRTLGMTPHEILLLLRRLCLPRSVHSIFAEICGHVASKEATTVCAESIVEHCSEPKAAATWSRARV